MGYRFMTSKSWFLLLISIAILIWVGTKRYENAVVVPKAEFAPTVIQPENRHPSVKSIAELVEVSWPDIELDGPLSEHYEDLVQRYRGGDHEAGYRLYHNLNACELEMTKRGFFNKQLYLLERNIKTLLSIKQTTAYEWQKVTKAVYVCDDALQMGYVEVL